MKCDFDFENPPDRGEFEGVVINRHRRVPKDAIAPQYGADEAPELAIFLENRSVKPPWLARLPWPSHRNGVGRWAETDPEWVVGLSAIAKPPQPRELDDDDDDDVEDVEEAKTGKWTGLQLDFSWSDSSGHGEHEPVANDFMAQALAGCALLWV
jgi:hypothetical protein